MAKSSQILRSNGGTILERLFQYPLSGCALSEPAIQQDGRYLFQLFDISGFIDRPSEAFLLERLSK